MKNRVLNLRDFPGELHQELKVRAVDAKVSLKAYIVKLLTEAVKHDGRAKKAAV